MREARDMLGRGGAMTVQEAREAIHKAFPPPLPDSEDADIRDAAGRVLAVDIVSPFSLPAFDRSSMDGYAVRAADTFGATESLPACLKVIGEVAMGSAPVFSIREGEAAAIPTGGMLPDGADAVVMLENTSRLSGDEIEVLKPAGPYENVVRAGDDIAEGAPMLSAGRRLRPQDLGALAGVGITRVQVFRRPVVAIINTGDEIVPADKEPGPGQVRDVNSYNLAALVRNSGGVPLVLGIFPDDFGSIENAVAEGLGRADMVAITGGSSVGTRDMTAAVIDGLGGPQGGVIVHGVLVKPGKPIVIGIARNKPVFGLPGHPVAVTVSYRLFVEPLLKELTGESDRLGLAGVPPVRVVRARMARNYSSGPGREDHMRVSLELADGELWATPVLGKSGLINTLVRADGSVVVPMNKLGLKKGEWVDVEIFD